MQSIISSTKRACVALAMWLSVCDGKAGDGPEPESNGKRVGIVFSETSANFFFDPIAYSQLFMALQHQSMMAGIPYDLLSEADLVDLDRLIRYDSLVFAHASHVDGARVELIESALTTAVDQYGVGLIAAGDFLTNDELGAPLPGDPTARMTELFGLSPARYLSGVATTVVVSDPSHPMLIDYLPEEEIIRYSNAFFGHFVPVEGDPGLSVVEHRVGDERFNACVVREGAARSVHFSDLETMIDSNLVWQAIQWVVNGDSPLAGLKLSRNDSIFAARNDMDQSAFSERIDDVTVPIVELTEQWNRDFNFVGSYYINIGNAPEAGMFQDWERTVPLYQRLTARGNEIGNHSFTHPFQIDSLTPEEFDFEFVESKTQIEANLGIPIRGVAIPGDAESLASDARLGQVYEYISGRYSSTGAGFRGAIGRLFPGDEYLYYHLNLQPDFTLIEFQGLDAAEATATWLRRIDDLSAHACQPIVHWLWHDYGPTIATDRGYTMEMYEAVIRHAAEANTEFVTGSDLAERIRNFESARIECTETETGMTVRVAGAGLGKFALKLGSRPLGSVADWYAYSDDTIFLPENGGEFDLTFDEENSAVTRIVSLPMRAVLHEVSGDGTELKFSLLGQGDVSLDLHPELAEEFQIEGLDEDRYRRSGGGLELTLNEEKRWEIAITRPEPPPTTPPCEVPERIGETIVLLQSNHKYRTFTAWELAEPLRYHCPDLKIRSVAIKGIASDEPENGKGDGNTVNDIVIADDCGSAQLRAERRGGGNGRVYTVALRIVDQDGETHRVVRKITVPRNKKSHAVDDGPYAGYRVEGECRDRPTETTSARYETDHPTITAIIPPARGGKPKIKIKGKPGCKCVLEISTNLSDWAPQQSIVIDSTGVQTVTDTEANQAVPRFYRIR